MRLPRTRVNRAIRAQNVRVIDQEGKQLGVLGIQDAIKTAEEAGLDLVEISGGADPPVCKIMDYGKYKYQQSKKAHTAKKKQSVIVVKEMRMRPRTDEHDLQYKLRNIKKFLESGNKVRVFILFRGRELAHTELGRKMLDRVADELKDVSTVEQHPKREGRRMIMVFAPMSK
ncbi:MAG: translation initiation factor IF-3 [Thermodesulfobacteriota bacterium]